MPNDQLASRQQTEDPEKTASLASRIDQLLTEDDRRVQDIADEIGSDPMYLSHLRRHYRTPSIDMILKLERALGRPIINIAED